MTQHTATAICQDCKTRFPNGIALCAKHAAVEDMHRVCELLKQADSVLSGSPVDAEEGDWENYQQLIYKATSIAKEIMGR